MRLRESEKIQVVLKSGSILKQSEFFWANYWIYELWSTSIHFKDWISLRKQLSFSSKLFKLWKFEVDQFISSIESVWEKVNIFRQTIQLWRFSFFPSCFIDEIDSRVCFHARYLSLKKVENLLFYVLRRSQKTIVL